MFKSEVIGNLGSDAQVKNEGGKPFVTFSVAHRDKWVDANSQTHESVQWVDVIIGDADSPIVPFLKSGVKVFVRGNARLRVFSSAKDRCMKAGLTIWAHDVELCGGSTDAVPRQLICPENGQIIDVEKYYWVNVDTKSMKKDECRQFIDKQGNNYLMNKSGFVYAAPESQDENSQEPKE